VFLLPVIFLALWKQPGADAEEAWTGGGRVRRFRVVTAATALIVIGMAALFEPARIARLFTEDGQFGIPGSHALIQQLRVLLGMTGGALLVAGATGGVWRWLDSKSRIVTWPGSGRRGRTARLASNTTARFGTERRDM
jgi:hypothetical protein